MAIRLCLHAPQSYKFIDNVALVAGTHGGAENLLLDTLSAALKSRGVRPLIFPYQSVADIDVIAAQILLTFPSLVCVFFSNGSVAIDSVALIQRLRRMGYTGHITASGAYAASTAQELLTSVPQIDSVTGDGDAPPLAQLAESICHNRYPEPIIGVHTNSGASQCDIAKQHAFLCQQPPLREKPKECASVPSSDTACQIPKPNRYPGYIRLIKSFPVTADTRQQPALSDRHSKQR